MGRVRALGSARQGTEETSRLRFTSLALAPLTLGFVWLVLSLLHKDYNGARAELGEPIPAILVLLFVLTGVYHMQIGMRSVIRDYIHGGAAEWALIANVFFSAVVGLACVYALLRIGFV
jgi:succinate dehydrogenase / fumarate reductase membrane anchor subunit